VDSKCGIPTSIVTNSTIASISRIDCISRSSSNIFTKCFDNIGKSASLIFVCCIGIRNSLQTMFHKRQKKRLPIPRPLTKSQQFPTARTACCATIFLYVFDCTKTGATTHSKHTPPIVRLSLFFFFLFLSLKSAVSNFPYPINPNRKCRS
jgi:hypothetical protein